MRRLLVLMIELVLCIFPLFAQQPKEEREAGKTDFVMILSSYLYESEWSTSLAKEIRNQLETKNSQLKVHITYAGVNSHNSFLSDRFAMQGAFAYGRLNNQIVIPDVLVLIGDESWMLYRIMNHRGRWEKIPIVLCGTHLEIMKDYSAYFPDMQIPDSSLIPLSSTVANFKFKAVVEPDNSMQTVKLAKKIMPHIKQIYYLRDGSYWDCYQKKKLQKAIGMICPDVTLIELRRGKNNADSIYNVLNNLAGDKIVLTNGLRVPDTVQIPVLTLRDIDYKNHVPLGGYFAPVSDYAQKAANTVLDLLKMEEQQGNNFLLPTDTAYYLNQTALLNAGLRSQVSELPNSIDRHIPPPFVLRHARIIAMILLIGIVLIYVTVRAWYARNHQHNLKTLFTRYKSLYNEYLTVYENMPIGLLLFDISGRLLNRNAETDNFFEHFEFVRKHAFRLYDSDILDKSMHEALFRKEMVSRMLFLKPYSYRILLRMIDDEESGDNCILVMVIDNTDIEQEKEEKEKICEVLNFAMDKSSLGVAEYNLMDYSGFATDAWYDVLNQKRGLDDFSDVHKFLVREDREKVEMYLDMVRHGVTKMFLDSLKLQTVDGDTHYVRYQIQPLEYTPEKNRVIVSELILNMDEQVSREHELKAAMKKAQEADCLKNSFVANMKDEIRTPLSEIIACAQELVMTSNMERRKELNKRIEENNRVMLAILQHIIDVSKVELNQ